MSNINDFVIENGILKKYTGNATEVVIPDGVTKIYWSAFENCTALTSVTIPESIVDIGTYAFSGCTSLKSIIIPDSVKSIDWESFRRCTSLEYVSIGKSVNKIGSRVFEGCTSLKKISIMGSCLDNTSLKVISEAPCLSVLVAQEISFDVLKKQGLGVAAAMGYLLNRELFNNHPEEEQYRKYISSQRKKLLPEIFKRDLVDCISFYEQHGVITKKNADEEFFNPAQEANAVKCVAFLMDWKNKNMAQKDIDKQLGKELTKDPFNATDMKKLWSFEKLEDGTLKITSYKGAETVVSIPERIGNQAVTEIAAGAFSTSYGSRKTQGAKANLRNIKEIIIPDSVVSIGSYAFEYCTSLSNVTIGNSVKSIGSFAFSNCAALTNVSLGNSVTSIGGSAFAHCVSLATITIPESVESIRLYAFSGCKSLATITIPKSIRRIEGNVFSGCTSLVSVNIPDSVTNIEGNAFENCTSLTDIVIPSSVVSIGNCSFKDCTSLTNIVISDSMKVIGEYVFSGCVSLARITIPGSVTRIERFAFDGCRSITDIYYAGSEKEWRYVSIAGGNKSFQKATVHFGED